MRPEFKPDQPMAVLESGNFGTVHESAAEGGVTTSGDTNLPAYTTAGATCSFDRRALLVMIMHTPPRRTSSN